MPGSEGIASIDYATPPGPVLLAANAYGNVPTSNFCQSGDIVNKGSLIIDDASPDLR